MFKKLLQQKLPFKRVGKVGVTLNLDLGESLKLVPSTLIVTYSPKQSKVDILNNKDESGEG